MSTFSEREEALRRALFNAAESVEPAADGLERIRARLRPPRPAPVAWLEGLWAGLVARGRGFIEDSRRWLVAGCAFVWHRFAPAHAAPGQRNLLRWLRPLTAMAVAIFVVAAGVYVGLSASLSISPTNTSTGSVSSSTHPGGNGNGTGAAKTASPSSSSGNPATSVSPSSSASCASKVPQVLPPPSNSSSPSPTTTTPAPGSGSTTPTTGSTSPTSTTTPATAGSQAPDGSSSDPASTVVTTAASRCSKHKKAKHTLTDAQGSAVPAVAVLAALLTGEARLSDNAS